MIISKPMPMWRQPLLFDEPLGNHGHIRNVIGLLCEELTAWMVGGVRHKTDSRCDYCPDVSTDDPRRYWESKAVGLSNKAFVYAGRLEKDRKFAAAGNDLSYVIWNHAADTKLASTVAGLRDLILNKMLAVFVVPFQELDAVCRMLPMELLNSAYGGTDRKCYGSGVCISLRRLEPWRRPVPRLTGLPSAAISTLPSELF